MSSWHLRIERLLLTAWVGGMWGVGYLAVPVLFSQIDSRMLAGNIAGSMFTAMSYFGLFCGALILYLGWYHYPRWRNLAVISMLGLIAIGQFVIRPQMEVLRASGLIEGSAERANFALLHGAASFLFLATSVLGMILVAFGTHRRQ